MSVKFFAPVVFAYGQCLQMGQAVLSLVALIKRDSDNQSPCHPKQSLTTPPFPLFPLFLFFLALIVRCSAFPFFWAAFLLFLHCLQHARGWSAWLYMMKGGMTGFVRDGFGWNTMGGRMSGTSSSGLWQECISTQLAMNIDTQVASDFKSNPLGIWNHSASNHCDFSVGFCPPLPQI